MLKLFVLVVLAALAAPASAGDASEGFTCSNACPLAKQANVLRASGGEAVATSAIVRADVVRTVERNLSRI